MAENKFYLAVGEEAARGTAESSVVGFIPLVSPGIPKMEFGDSKRKEFRGEDTVLGDTHARRLSRKWSAGIKMPFFTQAGGAAGMVGTLVKHFFGRADSAQNGATGQYYHMFYPVSDPFSGSNLGDKALTLNCNVNEGAVMKNWPYVGGRVKSISFDQEAGQPLIVSVEMIGQKKSATTAELGSPVFAAESLRCDYNAMKLYTGAVTRTGAGPAFTQLGFDSATLIKPDKFSIKLENGMDDVLRLGGVDYPDRTRMGQFKLSAELTIDWEDPVSGFSSVDEFNAWLSGISETNLCAVWDTGVQAGSGDNHMLIIDVPRARRLGGEPGVALDKDPMITLKFEGLFDSTTCKYLVGVMLKNTVGSV